MWSKRCHRPGCPFKVWAVSRAALAAKAYCGLACRRAHEPRAIRRPYVPPAPVLEAPPGPVVEVPSPSNNLTHRRIADRQLALIAKELERIRLSRRRTA